MHERSLAQALLTQITQVAAEYPGLVPRAATVDVGPLAGVEPLLLEFAFTEVATERGLPELELVLRQVPLGMHCDSCQQDSELDSLSFQCPQCDSHQIHITQGDGVILVHVDLVQPGDTV